jgi:hypothetical protein
LDYLVIKLSPIIFPAMLIKTDQILFKLLFSFGH